jgi:hypothetical protein
MTSKQEAEQLIQEWVRKGLLKKGKTNTGLAKALGLEQPRIPEIKDGRRRVQAAELPVIASYLEEPVPPQLVEVTDPWQRVIVSGTVQAGYWAEPNEDRAGEPEVLQVPLPEILRSIPIQGIRVEGDSMNKVFPAGTRLVCASLYDLHEEEPIAGKRYIVRRTRADGAVEMTVKEAEQDATGKWWLWPRSTDPRHQEPIPFDTKEGDAIEVTARVLYSVRPE